MSKFCLCLRSSSCEKKRSERWRSWGHSMGKMEYEEYVECVLIGVSSAPCSRQYFSSIFTFLVIDLRETSEHAISATSRWIILYLVIYTRFTLYEMTNNYEEHSGHSGRFILLYFWYTGGASFPSLTERSAHFGSTTNTARHAKSAKLEDGEKKQQARTTSTTPRTVGRKVNHVRRKKKKTEKSQTI